MKLYRCRQYMECYNGTSELVPVDRRDGSKVRVCPHEDAHTKDNCNTCKNRDYELPIFEHQYAQCIAVKE
jgi:hypothetical protein